MPDFRPSGTKPRDFWLIDGSCDFAVIPGGVFTGIDVNTPIRLQNGTPHYGFQHIRSRHNHWVTRQEPTGCIATLLHRKLSQSGRLHVAEAEKLTLAMRVSPEAVVILRHIRPAGFLTVVTMYYRQGAIEGDSLGRYLGYEWASSPYVAAR